VGHSRAKWPERPQLKQVWPEVVLAVGGSFAENCLSVSHFVSAITSSIVGVSLCMSTWSQCKVHRAPWSTLCPQWSSGEVSIAVATRLIDHNSVKLYLARNL
jgi:hypothetical protein